LPATFALVGLVIWWVSRAYNEVSSADLGLAYEGGVVAWATGHPEHLNTWISTPFLGAVMATVTRLVSVRVAADLITTLNLALVVGAATVTLKRLHGRVRPWAWWLAALAMLSFGPMMSSVWWKQFNLIALVAALLGFDFLRRRRPRAGAALIGFSVAVKPLAIVLPFVLLARRETRRAGLIALGWLIALNVMAQGFMAERAGSLSTLNLLPVLRNFAEKSKPENSWACHPENFAPGSLLCRLAGSQNWNVQHVIVWAGVALLSMWVAGALRGYKMISWEVFAFSCAISTMISPIAWDHYQVMLAPLFVLLLVRMTTDGSLLGTWCGLVVAFGLASLMWQPFGTSIGALRHVADGSAQTQRALFSIAAVAQFAQYILVLTGVVWYLQARVTAPRGRRYETPVGI
jgi:hypothetical protein